VPFWHSTYLTTETISACQVSRCLEKLVDYVNVDDVVVKLANPGFVKGAKLSRNLPDARKAMCLLLLLP